VLLFADPRVIVAIAIALVVGITFHEFSHAFVADQLGDHRPRAMGRVTLNPVAHIEPLGALFFVLAGFGWGKPVQVNPAALRSGGLGAVALAGPVANLVVALAFALAYRVIALAGVDLPYLSGIIQFVVLFNVALGLFNLLPIPPLDGYNLALALLPPRQAYTLRQYSQYGFLLLLGLILLSYGPIFGPIDWIFAGADWAVELLTGAPLRL
jgi:Zn-dependent protease